MEKQKSGLESYAEADSVIDRPKDALDQTAHVEALHLEWDVLITGGPEALAAHPNWDQSEGK